ncbi:hypothetical protein BLNAU_13138 [Blattamonas nauphoetae]|uniref:Uncharacterized protein n=1 Tax=Blattamonas nauphoetae TaxID=2049346 RepID=A0ABQ9XKI7_9EUKA|nr:hypothetical protein BLNAU_13138 [Blattamonas nauphoetae]
MKQVTDQERELLDKEEQLLQREKTLQQKNDELTQQIQNLEHTIKNNNKTISDLKTNQKRLVEENQELRKRTTDTKKEQSMKEEELQKAKEEVKRAKARIAMMQQGQKDNEQKKKKAEEQKQSDVDERVRQLEAERDKERQRFESQLQAEVDERKRLQAELNELRKTNATLIEHLVQRPKEPSEVEQKQDEQYPDSESYIDIQSEDEDEEEVSEPEPITKRAKETVDAELHTLLDRLGLSLVETPKKGEHTSPQQPEQDDSHPQTEYDESVYKGKKGSLRKVRRTQQRPRSPQTRHRSSSARKASTMQQTQKTNKSRPPSPSKPKQEKKPLRRNKSPQKKVAQSPAKRRSPVRRSQSSKRVPTRSPSPRRKDHGQEETLPKQADVGDRTQQNTTPSAQKQSSPLHQSPSHEQNVPSSSSPPHTIPQNQFRSQFQPQENITASPEFQHQPSHPTDTPPSTPHTSLNRHSGPSEVVHHDLQYPIPEPTQTMEAQLQPTPNNHHKPFDDESIQTSSQNVQPKQTTVSPRKHTIMKQSPQVSLNLHFDLTPQDPPIQPPLIETSRSDTEKFSEIPTKQEERNDLHTFSQISEQPATVSPSERTQSSSPPQDFVEQPLSDSEDETAGIKQEHEQDQHQRYSPKRDSPRHDSSPHDTRKQIDSRVEPAKDESAEDLEGARMLSTIVPILNGIASSNDGIESTSLFTSFSSLLPFSSALRLVDFDVQLMFVQLLLGLFQNDTRSLITPSSKLTTPGISSLLQKHHLAFISSTQKEELAAGRHLLNALWSLLDDETSFDTTSSNQNQGSSWFNLNFCVLRLTLSYGVPDDVSDSAPETFLLSQMNQVVNALVKRRNPQVEKDLCVNGCSEIASLLLLTRQPALIQAAAFFLLQISSSVQPPLTTLSSMNQSALSQGDQSNKSFTPHGSRSGVGATMIKDEFYTEMDSDWFCTIVYFSLKYLIDNADQEEATEALNSVSILLERITKQSLFIKTTQIFQPLTRLIQTYLGKHKGSVTSPNPRQIRDKSQSKRALNVINFQGVMNHLLD